MPDRPTAAPPPQATATPSALAGQELRETVAEKGASSGLAEGPAARYRSGERSIPGVARDGMQPFKSGNFCGVVDAGADSLHVQTFGAPGGRWSRGALKYSISPAGANFANPSGTAPTNPAAVIAAAFAKWQSVSLYFSFTQVGVNSGEDIRVVFGNAGVDPSFGQPGGVLASAGYPERGNVQFDSAESWSAANLLPTALHELGHCLGLSHSDDPASLMYPYSRPAPVIDDESRLALQAIYGWSGQQRLGDRATSDHAALGITTLVGFDLHQETAHMAWKGIGDDTAIYTSQFGRGGWSAAQHAPRIGSSHSPALTQFKLPGSIPNTGLFMAWKGIPGDAGLYWSRNFGGGFEDQSSVANVGTSSRPSLASVNGAIYMAWKGIAGDDSLYWSTFGANAAFGAQQNVRGVGSSDAPAILGFNNRLYMFWKGIEGDSNAYWSSFDFANDPIWKPQRRIEFFSYEVGGGVPIAVGTSGSLSATVRNDKIVVAWKGAQGDTDIWFSFFKDDEFSGQTRLANTGTAVGPSIVHAGAQTFIAWRGTGDDGNI